MLNVTDAWRQAYPGASQGLLVIKTVVNPESHAELEQRKTDLESQLRTQYAGYDRAAFNALASMQPYGQYYAKFKKTYHVQLQLESVVLKGKSLPVVAALVEAMFMAELKNQLLTAGHDFDTLRQPIKLDIAKGNERYTLMNGKEETLKPDDMYMADADGIISSIIYGPDGRSRINPSTHNVLFTVYAPAGINQSAVRQHLEDIRDNVLLIAPEAAVETLEIAT